MTIETLEQGVKGVNKACSSVCIVNFEQVIVDWVLPSNEYRQTVFRSVSQI